MQLPFEAPIRLSKEDANLDIDSFKRASVAIILYGDDILIIKRSERESDRWSGHIGLPGGRREPNETDLDAAIRETKEEVGVDLHQAKYLGALPPRIIRVKGGTLPVMILCPFVFQLPISELAPTLTPQPSEVAAVFWYPLTKLYDVKNHTQITVVSPEGRSNTFKAIEITPSNIVASTKALSPPFKMWGITYGIIMEYEQHINRNN